MKSRFTLGCVYSALVIFAYVFDTATTILTSSMALETNPLVRNLPLSQYLLFTGLRIFLALVLVWVVLPKELILKAKESPEKHSKWALFPYEKPVFQLPWLAINLLLTIKISAAISNMHLFYYQSPLLSLPRNWHLYPLTGPLFWLLAGSFAFLGHQLSLYFLWQSQSP